MTSFAKSALCLLVAGPLVAAAFVSGCSSDPSGSSGSATQSSGSASTGSAGGGMGGSGNGGAGGNGGATGTGGNIPAPTEIAKCLNQVYQCGDLIDNDKDGLLDSQDPDCLGPCDNTENSYYSGIPGGSGPGCLQDCYWDSDSGSGNDECYWNHQCDPLSVAPDYYPEWWYGNKCAYNAGANTPGTNLSCSELLNTQPATCENICPKLTPNGCDCFGCCELPAGSGSFVWLGTEDGAGQGACTIDGLGDPKKCAPCTPVQGACFNGCGKCELCLGKDTLPPECLGGTGGGGGAGGADGGGSTEQCPGGEQPCGLTGQEPCASGFYCITGCCIPQPK